MIEPPEAGLATVLKTIPMRRKRFTSSFASAPKGISCIFRNIYFDRYTLDLSRQKTFDKAVNVTSDTRYSNWKDFSGVRFPATIDMQRPVDGY